MDFEDEELEWQRDVLAELDAELRGYQPLAQYIHGVRFVSRSFGRGRARQYPRVVILVKLGGGKWKYWNGGDGREVPWDELAQEVYSQGFLDSLKEPPGDYLRQQVLRILEEDGSI